MHGISGLHELFSSLINTNGIWQDFLPYVGDVEIFEDMWMGNII